MQVLFHSDFEYHGLTAWPGLERDFRGTQNMLPRANRVDSELDEVHGRPVELVEIGQRVLCVLEITGSGKQSRVPLRFTEASVFTVRDGQVLRMEVCESREAALDVIRAAE